MTVVEKGQKWSKFFIAKINLANWFAVSSEECCFSVLCYFTQANLRFREHSFSEWNAHILNKNLLKVNMIILSRKCLVFCNLLPVSLLKRLTCWQAGKCTEIKHWWFCRKKTNQGIIPISKFRCTSDVIQVHLWTPCRLTFTCTF